MIHTKAVAVQAGSRLGVPEPNLVVQRSRGNNAGMGGMESDLHLHKRTRVSEINIRAVDSSLNAILKVSL